MYVTDRLLIVVILHLVTSRKTNVELPETEVDELQPEGTFVANLRTILPMISMSSSYSIISDEISRHFKLCNLTFNLYIRERLDHRKLCVDKRMCKCERCILHLSVAFSIQSKILLEFVKLVVLDIDNHRPLFPQSSFTFLADENKDRQWIELPNAEDMDFIDSGNLQYHLNFSNPGERDLFSLDKRNGVMGLNIKMPLDRETQTQYELWLSAVGRTLSGTCEIIVVVNDENDNAPFCNDSENTFTVSSSYRGYVGRVSAFDLDAVNTPHSLLSYAFPEGQNNSDLLLNVSDGSLSITSALDAKHALIQIAVIVADSGSPQLHTQCTISISVVKAPLLAFSSSTESVVVRQFDKSVYISRALRKGQRVADIDTWLPYITQDVTWSFECNESSFELVKLSPGRMALNLLTNLNDAPAHLDVMICCYDTGSLMVRSDYLMHVHMLSPSRYRMRYPANGTVVQISSLQQIDPGPAFKIKLARYHALKPSHEMAEPVSYQIDSFDNPPILLQVKETDNVYIENVWYPGRYTFHLGIVGNQSGFLYHRVVALMEISENAFSEFSKTSKHQFISIGSIRKRHQTYPGHRLVMKTGITGNIVFRVSLLLGLLLFLLLFAVIICINSKCLGHGCKKDEKTSRWCGRPKISDYYISQPNIKYSYSFIDFEPKANSSGANDFNDKLTTGYMGSVKVNPSAEQCFFEHSDSEESDADLSRSPRDSCSSVFKSTINSTLKGQARIMSETIDPRIFLSADRVMPPRFSATLDESKLFFHQSSFV